MNEVLANRASEILAAFAVWNASCIPMMTSIRVKAQNDVPNRHARGMLLALREHLIPQLSVQRIRFAINPTLPILSPGRTHLQDATPLTQAEISGWVAMLEHNSGTLSTQFTARRRTGARRNRSGDRA